MISPPPQGGDCGFEPRTEHWPTPREGTRPAWRSGRIGRVGGLSSRVICGFKARLRYCGVAKLVRRQPHKLEMRGFESRPRYERRSTIRCRSTAGRRPVKAAIGVRIPAPEPWAVVSAVSTPPRQGGRAGSNPVGLAHARVAQMAEHYLDTVGAAGSNPAADTKLL